MGAFFTVTVQAADFPFDVVTVITDVPIFSAFIFPVLSTVATKRLWLCHVYPVTESEGVSVFTSLYD